MKNIRATKISKKLFPDTIIHKIFETNSSFQVNLGLREILTSIIQEIISSADKIFISGRGQGIGNNSMTF